MIQGRSGTAVAVEADVTNRGDCEQMVGVAVERFGQLNILHNNVGIGSRPGSARSPRTSGTA